MATFGRVVMRALMIFLYSAIRIVGLTVIERSELAMINAQHLAAALEQLQADHRKSRLRATVECGLLTILAFYAALKITMPSLLVGWP